MTRVAAAAVARVSRADWRFLLPQPEGGFAYAVVLGGPPGLVERLLELGFARVISQSIEHAAQADAVIVLHDAGIDPGELVAMLSPGRVVYIEVDRRRGKGLLWTPSRLARRLRAAGFVAAGIYWVLPHFDAATRFIPLRAARAVEWYLETTYRQFSWGRRLVAALARVVTRGDSRRFTPLAPCFSIVAVEESASQMPAVLTTLDLSPGTLEDTTAVALLTSGQDDGSRVVLLPFGTDGLPLVAIKLARVPAFNAHTAREHAMLLDVRSRVSREFGRTIPAPHASGTWSGLTVSVESFAQGRTLLASTGRRGTPVAGQIDDLRVAADWLTSFHEQACRSNEPWSASDITLWLDQPFETYLQLFGATPDVAKLFAATRERAERLIGNRLPIVLQHNDFGPWNAHRSSRGITVIDWESTVPVSSRYGPPLTDLIYFVTYWLFAATRSAGPAARRQAIAQLFSDTPATGRAAAAGRDAIARYLTALEIDPGFLPVLNVLTWVRLAIDRPARQALSAGGRNEYVDFVEALARAAQAAAPRVPPTA